MLFTILKELQVMKMYRLYLFLGQINTSVIANKFTILLSIKCLLHFLMMLKLMYCIVFDKLRFQLLLEFDADSTKL